MPDMLHQHYAPFSRDAITSNCWVSLLYALLMQFAWRASFLQSIVAFAFMRPTHSSTLLSWYLSTMFLDPHEFSRVLPNPMPLDKATISFLSYVGALVTLRLIGAIIFLVLCVSSFLWAHLVMEVSLFLAILVSMAVLGETADIAIRRLTYYFENFPWYARNYIHSGRLQLTLRRRLYRAWATLLAYERQLAVGERIPRLLGRTPYAELPPFVYSPVTPTTQIRLLELERRTFFSLPTATLRVYTSDDNNIPPYEAVSFSKSQTDLPSLPLVLNNKSHHVPADVHAILCRLTNFFTRRVIWIDAICVNHGDKDEETGYLERDRTGSILGNSVRVLVCLGESPSANLAVGMVNALILMLWNSESAGAAESFASFCENPRNEAEEACLDGFLALLDHPWFEDPERFEQVMRSGQVTILYGNEALMELYLTQLGGVLEAWDEERIRVALTRAGKEIFWPLRGVASFVGWTKARRQEEMMERMKAVFQTTPEFLSALVEALGWGGLQA